MLTQLRLRNFKGFKDATLKLGPLSLVIGANASGKSNLRDAFRFIQGIGRGYNLAEIIGGKYGEGGYREWSGIRGGTRDICYAGEETFSLELDFAVPDLPLGRPYTLRYGITVRIEQADLMPRVEREFLHDTAKHEDWFEAQSHFSESNDVQMLSISAGERLFNFLKGAKILTQSTSPSISQLYHLGAEQLAAAELAVAAKNDFQKILPVSIRFSWVELFLWRVLQQMASMRFLDFVPDAMRQPAISGQTLLSEQGENLSSVLQGICAQPKQKTILQTAMRELTPMDVIDFKFVADPQGKVIVFLIEKGGRETSAYSASDGTLRFLGVLAALFGLRSADFLFFEEIDTGIHPARLYLLMNCLHEQTGKPFVPGRDGVSFDHRNLQICATTHSPQVLRLLDEKEFADSSLTYRTAGLNEARIKSLPDIPHLTEAMKSSDIARLYEGGWMEQTMFYEEGEPEPFVLAPEENPV